MDPDREVDLAALRPRLEAVVRQACPPWLGSQVDDLVQQAWLKIREILTHRADGEGRAPLPSSYVWKVAHSVTVDEIRRHRRRREESLDGPQMEEAGGRDAIDPERRLAARETGRAIRDCLAGVLAPRRRALGLYLLGHGVRECSELLAQDYKRMENLILRGMADMRTCLAAKGVTW